MITGFNTDVEYDGKVFHVQTEEKGRANPVVESLVYSGGEIVDSVRSSYRDLLESPGYSEDEVFRRMEGQHQAMIRDIASGKYDPEGPKPFGSGIITNRSLDEVVLEYLGLEFGVEHIRLELNRSAALVPGGRPRLRLRVVEESTDRPVAGAAITVSLASPGPGPRELCSGVTDRDGCYETDLWLPARIDGEAAIVCRARAGLAEAELRRAVR
jgi:hypothetical protein